MWGWVSLQSVGLGPLAISGAGSPFNQWGWVLLQSTGGRIYCRYLAPWSTRPPSTVHVSVPLLIQILGAWPPFIIRGLVPFYCVGVDPPSILRGCGPFQSEGLGPLSSNVAGSPSTLWG